jgi:hypothetical protein
LQGQKQTGHAHHDVDQSTQQRSVTQQCRHKIEAEQTDKPLVECANYNQNQNESVDELHSVAPLA